MDSRHLRAFVAVAECGGISAAAQRLGFAQSSLSDQIGRLERELQVAVLHRTPAGVTLTEAGERLLPYARQALELDGELRRVATQSRPRLRIGALESLASAWLPDILAAFGHRAGRSGVPADIALTVSGRRQLADGLADGTLDLIFLFDNGRTAPPGPREVVAQDETVLVAAPEHPLARQSRAVSIEAVLDSDFLIAEPGCTAQMLVDRFGRDLTGGAPVGMVTGSLGALLRLLSLGQGLALLPRLTAADHLADGDLAEIALPAGCLRPVHIEARWRAGLGPAEPALHLLLDLARQFGPALPQEARTGS